MIWQLFSIIGIVLLKFFLHDGILHRHGMKNFPRLQLQQVWLGKKDFFLHIPRHLKIYKVIYRGNYCLWVWFYLMILIYNHLILCKREYSKDTKVSWMWFKDFWTEKGFHSGKRIVILNCPVAWWYILSTQNLQRHHSDVSLYLQEA